MKKKNNRRTKKAGRELAELSGEIQLQLEGAKFDEAGFRLHDPTLFEAGQIFSPWLPSKGMDKQKLISLLAQEYARECRLAYDYQTEFLFLMAMSPNLEADAFRSKWPSWMLEIVHPLFPHSPLFGMEQGEIKKALAPAPAASGVPLSESKINPSSNDRQPIKDYAFTIDWRKGPEAIERTLAAWIRENAPPELPTLRGRNNAIDRFHELAAYRAKRAGLDHVEFGVLVGRKGGDAIYSDQPQFLRAVRATARRIKKFDSDFRRLIAAHRKKNK